jgi:acetyltransferase-like isoleucine patch superfamily enzyme
MRPLDISRFLALELPIHVACRLIDLLPNLYQTTQLRGLVMRPLFGKCGRRLRVASGVIILKPSRLDIGDDVYIAHNAWINAAGGMQIGTKSVIGPMCVLVTSRHVFEGGEATNKGAYRPVALGRGTWLASHVVVTDGVTIGNGALVGAGSVVTKDVPDGAFVGGVPAKPIRRHDGSST